MDDIRSTLEQRGAVYGDYSSGVKLRSTIMKEILHEYQMNHNCTEMPKIYEGMILDIVNKLIRIAVTPDHIDSWRDVAGYATLTKDYLEKINEGN